jgi:hypothetical protein
MYKNQTNRNRPFHEMVLQPEFRGILRLLGPKQRQELIDQSMAAYDEKIKEIFRKHSGEFNPGNDAN